MDERVSSAASDSSAAPRRRSLWRRAAFSVAVFVVALGGLEVVARVVRDDDAFLVPDPRLGYANEPGFDGRFGVTTRTRVRIDASGFRVPVDERSSETSGNVTREDQRPWRIVCLGDSCTFGFDVEAREAYPELLEARLQEKAGARGVEVFNAGVIGYSTRHGRRLLEERILPLRPDVVTIAYNVANRVIRLENPAPGELAHERTGGGPIVRLARYSELVDWAYDLGLRWFSSRHRGGEWLASYDRNDDPLFVEKQRMVAEFDRLQPFVPVAEHEAALDAMVRAARAAGADVVLVSFGENPRLGGPLEEADARLDADEPAAAATAIEAYFDDDKSDLSYQNNLDILANHLRGVARREAGLESGRGELRFPSRRPTLQGIVIRTQRRYVAAADRVAARHGARHLDLRESMNEQPRWFLDFVHFGTKAHAHVAERLAPVVAEMLSMDESRQPGGAPADR